MYLQFFPIYGFMVGVNYWSNRLDGDEQSVETEHLFQVMFFIIGVSFHIWVRRD
jgi:hypothetical protein